MGNCDYDVIVIGLGCAGAATCSELAKNGLDVLGIEQFDLVNESGSSHGDIRLFRFAYHEGEQYVPLLYESIERWEDVSSYVDKTVFESNGSATIGIENSQKLDDARKTCENADISYTMYSGTEFSKEYEMWSLSDKHQVLYQSDGGILHSRNGIHGLINEAKERGAEIRTQTEVKSWESNSECVSIELSGKTLTTDSVVITTGPWASEINEMRDLLTVERHLVSYLNYTTEDELFTSKNAPIWIFDGGEENRFYGAPSIENATEIKLGNLSPNSETGPISQLERGWDLYELLPEVEFARSNFSSQPSTVRGEVCPLTHSPDGDFIIDESVEYDNVYYGVGLSGHGLKFAPAIGRLLSDCVIKDKTKPMFSLTRFEE